MVEGRGGSKGGVEGPGEDELGRFWELLDADTQPIMPIPGCQESQKIFEEHKEVIYTCLFFRFNLRLSSNFYSYVRRILHSPKNLYVRSCIENETEN